VRTTHGPHDTGALLVKMVFLFLISARFLLRLEEIDRLIRGL
jgi:hypothetical protein